MWPCISYLPSQSLNFLLLEWGHSADFMNCWWDKQKRKHLGQPSPLNHGAQDPRSISHLGSSACICSILSPLGVLPWLRALAWSTHSVQMEGRWEHSLGASLRANKSKWEEIGTQIRGWHLKYRVNMEDLMKSGSDGTYMMQAGERRIGHVREGRAFETKRDLIQGLYSATY